MEKADCLSNLLSSLKLEGESTPGESSNSSFQVHPVMESLEHWFYKWLPSDINVKETLSTVGKVLKEKFANLDESMILQELKTMPIETITANLIACFCQISLLEDMKVINESLTYVKGLMETGLQHDYITENMLEGLIYLFSVMEAYKQSTLIGQNGSESTENTVKGYLEENCSYESLPALAQTTVKAAHSIFLGSCRNFEKQLKLLDEAMEEDPETLEWKISFLLVRKMERKQIRNEKPSQKEKGLLLDCLSKDPTHSMVKLIVCIYLSDLIKNRAEPRNNDDLIISEELNLKFNSSTEVISYIKDKAEEILLEMSHSVRVNLHIVECVTARLPYNLRDYPLAKKCLDAALKTNPKSSKANHRMAVILLFEKKFPQALTYLRQAMEFDPRNFPAYNDYIYVLLRDAEQNKVEIENSLNAAIQNAGEWSVSKPELVGKAKTFKGMFKFMTGEKRQALESWIGAIQICEAELNAALKFLPSLQKRYEFNTDLLTVSVLTQFLEEVLTTGGLTLAKVLTEEEKTSVRKMISILKSTDRNKNYEGVTAGRSRGRGSYSPGGSRQNDGNRRGRGAHHQPNNSGDGNWEQKSNFGENSNWRMRSDGEGNVRGKGGNVNARHTRGGRSRGQGRGEGGAGARGGLQQF